MTTDPELGVLVAKHQIEVDSEERKFDHSYKWESCCLRVDKRALSFFTQAAFSAGIVAFSVGMMVVHQDCAVQSLLALAYARYRSLAPFPKS